MKQQLKSMKHSLAPYYRPVRHWWYSHYQPSFSKINKKIKFILAPEHPHLPQSRAVADADDDVCIVSYGGVMTTALTKWLEQYKRVYSYRRGYNVHVSYPPISTNRRLRLVYIFGDPIMSVLSVFRRQCQMDGHYGYVSGDYYQCTRLAMRIKMRNLKAYLASDIGAFPIRQHFHNWRDAPTQHPILFIRAETIWDNLDVLQSFLELPDEAMADFPKQQKRTSSHNRFKLSQQEQDKLNQLYGDFGEEIKQMPDSTIRPADWLVDETRGGD